MPPRIRDIGALKLYDAVRDASVDSIESLLASGVNPNARVIDWDPAVSDMQTVLPPEFFSDEYQFPSLLRAAKSEVARSGTVEKRKTGRLMTALLEHGADPYALFPQFIRTHPNVPYFPGQPPDEQWLDEDVDLHGVRRTHRAAVEKALRGERRRKMLEEGVPSNEVEDLIDPNHLERDDDSAMEYEPRFPRKEGTCSVIHAMLVKGHFVQPVIEFLGNRLDIERRDPQGQTLFLAACRSKIGLDNLLAVDNYGQNALHHLLSCFNRATGYEPLIIDISLKYLLKNCPSLINQPTKAGIYPLQLALRRMGCVYSWSERDVPSTITHYETAVYDLLAANADPLVCDSRGNTTLHYLRGTMLGESVRMGDEQRRLLQVFIDRGVDVKARNKDDATALELFFMTGYDGMSEDDFGDEEVFSDIGNEVLDAFEKAGYDIMAKDANKQSLLHLVAGLRSYHSDAWLILLQDKGLDPMAEIRMDELLLYR
ncbi:unnamed protein product [Penicillium egyptiacum]|uniref:Ankyrin repeat protein n=1 Tax=Penicillium egyptiacum TaxID=1303716 RepID=A0A9W4KGD1_9EURO|nr:unnamed protein product [Penicillium egyptiacum]